MTNRGAVSGIRPSTWRDFVPTLRGFSSAGTGITQPDLSDSTRVARWLREPSGKVFYYGTITFGSSISSAAGETVFGLSLPWPANRSSNQADLPIGSAFAWQGSVSNKNMVLTPTLMDPLLPGGSQGNEDYYAQFFNARLVATGTDAITSAATSKSVTHGLANTPTANDIKIVPTATTTNNIGMWYVNNLGATTFDVNTKAAPGASTFAFSWKAEVDPNNSTSFDLLVAHAKPWQWASGHVLGWNFTYEGRR